MREFPAVCGTRTSVVGGRRWARRPVAGAAGVGDDTRYALENTAVSVQVVDDLPAVTAPTGRLGSVVVQRDLP